MAIYSPDFDPDTIDWDVWYYEPVPPRQERQELFERIMSTRMGRSDCEELLQMANRLIGRAKEINPRPAPDPPGRRKGFLVEAKRLRSLRKSRTGLNQDAFAAKCGIALSTVPRAESGKSRISMSSIEAMAGALEVTPEALIIRERES